jgi:hypothetical protein
MLLLPEHTDAGRPSHGEDSCLDLFHAKVKGIVDFVGTDVGALTAGGTVGIDVARRVSS